MDKYLAFSIRDEISPITKGLSAFFHNYTPLAVAISKGQLNEIIKIMRDSRVDVNDSGYQSMSNLTIACSGSNIGVVSLLLDRGAKIHNGEDSPIMTATKNYNANLVKFLIEKGFGASDLSECLAKVSKVRFICTSNRLERHNFQTSEIEKAFEICREETIKVLMDAGAVDYSREGFNELTIKILSESMNEFKKLMNIDEKIVSEIFLKALDRYREKKNVRKEDLGKLTVEYKKYFDELLDNPRRA